MSGIRIGRVLTWVCSTHGIAALLGTLIGLQAHTGLAYPDHPVEVIVPYAPGGGTDAMARTFAAEASKLTGQQWIVVNRDGAGGTVGFTALSRAKPDGYTIAFSPTSPMTNAPFVMPSMPFRNDAVIPVCQVFENVFGVVVRTDSPFRSFKEILEKAKEQPGKISFGHAGIGSVGHLSVVAIEGEGKVKFNEVAYRGDAPMITDTLSGILDFASAGISSTPGKNLRILAVYSDKRHPALPDVPSVTEYGLGGIVQGLNGLFAPAGLPKEIVERLEGICRQVTASPAFAVQARNFLQVPGFLDSAQFSVRTDSVYKLNAKILPGLLKEQK